ncbi:stage II sporulation protein M [Archaeoglobus veneficus]|uniref:Stage II sporulation protein M n=1 Tax=Archaeoglobus veneficus (strain DSM 11195 / SNP6) TaxID=693661 RepID=F2KNY3_ARCVS|nr:stage II sporulation protein M [Archaeoglobus veneficus]AEA46291.1 protein of unknown function DUF95 transmembrane [Archaeoglobus veneficus SNP6]
MLHGVSHVISRTAVEGIALSAALFLVSFVIGAVSGNARISPTNIQPPLYYILAVNLGLCLIMLLSGLLFGIPSSALLLYNGYMLGAKFKSALIFLGLNETVMRMFPHLFTEVIAIVLAASVGTTVIIGFVKKKEVNSKDLVPIAVLAVIMTVTSSYIEVYVTHNAVILSEVVR